MSQYDDTTGKELPDVNDLIEAAESAVDFEDYLQKLPVSDDPLLKLADKITEGFTAPIQVETLATYPGMTKTEPHEPAAPIIPDVSPEPTTPSNGQAPPETTTTYEVRNHPIIGTYVKEEVVAIGTEDWWAEVFINSRNLGVSQMTPEQIVEMLHRNEEAIRRTKTANQGLKAALEHHLTNMNAGQRAQILEKQRSLASKKVKKDETVAEKKVTTKKVTGNPMEKTIKTFVNLGMTAEEIEDQLKKTGKWDEGLRGLVTQLCS